MLKPEEEIEIQINYRPLDLFKLWLPTLQDSYIAYKNLTVDEQLLTFRGRCPLKQFISEKYGKEKFNIAWRDVYSTIFGYQDKTMLAFYCPKKGKIVTLLLTMHDSSQISETEKKKLQMIIDYNKRMSGVDTMDKLVRTYTVKRQAKKWPVTVFYNMIDINVLNTYIIWCHLNEDWRIKKVINDKTFSCS
ncbi:hypothetical protein ILUMI_02291 [Ignelater luminosus]|uniref:PiggyBac transposable element-derived protein domain-containing protein n=1 Tax=Ignelater luminosus TaxID=2038154 RepID=A0A8K0DIJ3_IGNLU|nr:hypothetical protein ILUMI_02291 [Ignelater luminosus]